MMMMMMMIMRYTMATQLAETCRSSLQVQIKFHYACVHLLVQKCTCIRLMNETLGTISRETSELHSVTETCSRFAATRCFHLQGV